MKRDLLSQNLVHLEHIQLVNIEYSFKSLVTHDFTSIAWILQFVAFDIVPQSLHNLWARKFIDFQESR